MVKRTWLIDIDDVLLAHTHGRPTNKLGFTDWQKLGGRPSTRPEGWWRAWYSPQLLHLLDTIIGDDDAFWLTTWLLDGDPNDLFSDIAGWRHLKHLPDISIQDSEDGSAGWWKADIVDTLHTRKDPLVAWPTETVWCENELIGTRLLRTEDLLDEHDALDHTTIIAPTMGALSRDQIESLRK